MSDETTAASDASPGPSYTYIESDGVPPVIGEWCVCDHCGSLVVDRPVHDVWHDSLRSHE